MKGQEVVLREGREWMRLRRIDPRDQLWLVTDGTVAAVGDIVRVPRLGWIDPRADPPPASPFEAEIVVDSVTGTVLLPESGTPFSPLRAALRILSVLESAGLDVQARIVREWLGPAMGGGKTKRRAA